MHIVRFKSATRKCFAMFAFYEPRIMECLYKTACVSHGLSYWILSPDPFLCWDFSHVHS